MKFKVSLLLTFLIMFISCDENFVNNKPIETQKSSKVLGMVLDSLYSYPINEVTSQLNGGNLSFITDSTGRFLMDSIPFGNYNLTFSTIGYESKSISLNISDTLVFLDSIFLARKKYPFEIITFNDLPTDQANLDSSYYGLMFYGSLPATEISKHNYDSNSWDEDYVNRFIDSIIIKILRSKMEIDTLWYQSYLNTCFPNPLQAFPPYIGIKLYTIDNRIRNLRFDHLNVNNWYNCSVRPFQYRRYSEFSE